MCGVALAEQRPRLGLALALVYYCLLRTQELLSLTFSQIALGPSFTGVLALPWAKSGQRRGAQEICTIDDPKLGRLLNAHHLWDAP